jgi:hypothetical protein
VQIKCANSLEGSHKSATVPCREVLTVTNVAMLFMVIEQAADLIADIAHALSP